MLISANWINWKYFYLNKPTTNVCTPEVFPLWICFFAAVLIRHVVARSTIYTDGWPTYVTLKDKGYEHYTVEHKHAFKCVYRNVDTGEVIDWGSHEQNWRGMEACKSKVTICHDASSSVRKTASACHVMK